MSTNFNPVVNSLNPAIVDTDKQFLEIADSQLRKASQASIETQKDYEFYEAEMVCLKFLLKEADARFDPIIAAAHATHKQALAQKAIVTNPLSQAYAKLSPLAAKWLSDQRRAREEEQRKALEAAQAAAIAEREQAIEAAEQNGASICEVQALCDMPVMVAPVTLPPSAPKSASVGLRAKMTASFDPSCKLAFIKHVAAHPNLIHLLDVNESNLNKLAMALQGVLDLPGVTVAQTMGVSTRTAPRGGNS